MIDPVEQLFVIIAKGLYEAAPYSFSQAQRIGEVLAPLKKLIYAEERVRFSRAHKIDCQFRGCTCGAAAEHNIAQGELTREWSAILEL